MLKSTMQMIPSQRKPVFRIDQRPSVALQELDQLVKVKEFCKEDRQELLKSLVDSIRMR